MLYEIIHNSSHVGTLNLSSHAGDCSCSIDIKSNELPDYFAIAKYLGSSSFDTYRLLSFLHGRVIPKDRQDISGILRGAGLREWNLHAMLFCWLGNVDADLTYIFPIEDLEFYRDMFVSDSAFEFAKKHNIESKELVLSGGRPYI